VRVDWVEGIPNRAACIELEIERFLWHDAFHMMIDATNPAKPDPTSLSFQAPMALWEGLPPRQLDAAGPDLVSVVFHGAGRDSVPLYGGARGNCDTFLLLPGAVLSSGPPGGLTCETLCIHADWLLEALRPLWSQEGLVRIVMAERLFPACRGLAEAIRLAPTPVEFEGLLAELACFRPRNDGDAGSLAMKTGALFKILALLSACHGRLEHGSQWPLQPAVWGVIDTIESAVAQGLAVDIANLATLAGMPQARFARMFRDAAGIAPRDYIQRRRIYHGARMLIEDMDTVTDIAFRLGFADTAHFCRVFKRVQGLTPNEYRRLHVRDSAEAIEAGETPGVERS